MQCLNLSSQIPVPIKSTAKKLLLSSRGLKVGSSIYKEIFSSHKMYFYLLYFIHSCSVFISQCCFWYFSFRSYHFMAGTVSENGFRSTDKCCILVFCRKEKNIFHCNLLWMWNIFLLNNSENEILASTVTSAEQLDLSMAIL